MKGKYPPYQPEEELVVLALIETNLPKLVAEDVIIFNELLEDFFPQAQRMEANTDMKTIIEEGLLVNNLEVVGTLVTKIQQLYQTIQVRQGAMLVGGTATGKTTAFKILAQILPKLNTKIESVKFYIINPKSMEMAYLWGEYNKNNSEWAEGLIAYISRKITSEESSSMSWLIFDGPVDSLWVENLNSVLDDNRVLCLANGKRIQIPNNFKFLFEVENLNAASPATVSRCGMIFFEANALSWNPILISWLKSSQTSKQLPESVILTFFKNL